VRRATDRLYARTLGPREREALDFVTANPGATIEDLQAAMGVGRKRIWQYIAKLEQSYVLRQGEPPMRFGPRSVAD
jgi:hypothetical protein